MRSGRHVAIMAHFNHWQEMRTDVVRKAIRRIRDTGAIIRSQAPLLNHVNNDPNVWARMWSTQVGLGIVPYYMFVERDTGCEVLFLRCRWCAATTCSGKQCNRSPVSDARFAVQA